MLPNRVRIYQQSKNLLGAIFDSSLASLHRIQVRCILLLSFFLFFFFFQNPDLVNFAQYTDLFDFTWRFVLVKFSFSLDF
jgi:hypothetical protein